MNDILLIYCVIGPTFKDRIISNLKTFESYKFFDVLILTDDVEYFKDLKYSNVKLMDLNYYRKFYPEFDQYECFPEEKRDDSIYRNQLFELSHIQNKKYSINIQRFGLLYENINKYQFISILDCDIIPVYTEDEFINFKNYLKNVMPFNSISTNKAYYTWNTEEHLSLLKRYSEELNKKIDINYPIDGCDGLFKIYKFESVEQTKEFFNTWNYVLLDSLKTKNVLYAGSWNILSEIVLGMTYKLLNIKVNGGTEHYIGVGGFRSFNFPEDRYWDDWTNQGFDKNVKNKSEFVKVNFEKLKKYYEGQNLKFNY